MKWLVGLGMLLLAAAGVFVFSITRDSDPASIDPNPSSSFRIVALGDSYISGEGAEHFMRGTDEPEPARQNLCRRASTAYPYLIAKQLDASLKFVACSGARTGDVIDSGQYIHTPPGTFGRTSQLAVLEHIRDPDVVLISIGGNDAGFSKIGFTCVVPFAKNDCRQHAGDWLRHLDERVYPAMERTFRRVRRAAPGVPVFALTYPIPIGPELCQVAGLEVGEMRFLRVRFVPQLNRLVRRATEQAGIGLIDLSEALSGYRFCEQPRRTRAINFVKFGHTIGSGVDIHQPSSFVRSTFHPNERGHEMMKRKVLPVIAAVRARALASAQP